MTSFMEFMYSVTIHFCSKINSSDVLQTSVSHTACMNAKTPVAHMHALILLSMAICACIIGKLEISI